ncbi:MAG: GtrA family protein [Vicinamibacterales bacterium]
MAFIRFNIVGIAGFAVQLGTLLALDAAGLPVLPATCLAVEAAILHNFAWHERWTWAGVAAGTRAGRLVRFHLSNGLISIVGNAALTGALVHAGAPLVLANGAAVLMCALLNFGAAHLWVFCATTWPTLHGHLH